MKLLSKRNIDATEGPLLSKIIIYAIPLILSSLIQQLFNAVDIVVLGNMDDSTAVASVSATGAITSLIVNTFVGIAVGTRVVVARSIGMKDEEQIKRVTDTSIIFSVVTGVVIAILGCVFAPWFLRITNCHADCFDGALMYIKIYVCAAPIILLYNFGSSVITADGDTQGPMYYILIGGAANVVLNIVLCLILPQKVSAVAIATVASQAISAFLVMKRLLTSTGHCRVDLKNMRFSGNSLGQVLATGLPSAFVSALFPLSNLQITSAINSFGVSAMAGSGASMTVESLSYTFSNPFGTTSAVFMSQNIGAQKEDRVKKSLWLCMLVGFIGSLALGVFLYLTGRFWLGIIVGDDKAAIDYGIVRMAYLVLPVAINAVNACYGSALQARGYAYLSSLNAILTVLVFRVFWMGFVFSSTPTWSCLMQCFLVSWTLRMVCNIIMYPIVNKLRRRKLTNA